MTDYNICPRCSSEVGYNCGCNNHELLEVMVDPRDYADAQAEIARLTAERDLLKNWQDHNANEVPRLKMQIESLTAELARSRAEAAAAYERAARVADKQPIANSIATKIRALATVDRTSALAEMLDAESRACVQIIRDNSMSSMAGEKAILARIDQRKEAGK